MSRLMGDWPGPRRSGPAPHENMTLLIPEQKHKDPELQFTCAPCLALWLRDMDTERSLALLFSFLSLFSVTLLAISSWSLQNFNHLFPSDPLFKCSFPVIFLLLFSSTLPHTFMMLVLFSPHLRRSVFCIVYFSTSAANVPSIKSETY